MFPYFKKKYMYNNGMTTQKCDALNYEINICNAYTL